MTSEKRINEMAELLKKREEEADQALNKLAEFTPLLYGAIAQVAKDLNAAGADLAQVEKKQWSGGRESLIFQWGKRRLIFIPLEDTAWPSSDSNLPDEEVQAARLVVFYQNVGDSTGTAVYNFYVFPNGAWAASGFGMPFHKQTFNQSILLDFAAHFLETAIKSNKWLALNELEFARVSQGARAAMGFATLKND